MLLYYLFWMLMGFILHFYIIFGTKLRIVGPTQIVVFFAYFRVSKKRNIKRSPNGVQTEWNLRERDFLNERDPGDLEWASRNNRGGHEAGGAPTLPRRALHSCGPPFLHRRTSSSYIYIHVPPKHPGAPRKPNSTAATFCTREIPSWGLFRSSTGGGIDHRGPLHQLHGLSGDVWVVYFRPSGP